MCVAISDDNIVIDQKTRGAPKSRISRAVGAMDRSRAKASIWHMALRTRLTKRATETRNNTKIGTWAIIPGHILAGI